MCNQVGQGWEDLDVSIGQIPGDGEGQGSLTCCSSWVHKESDMTQRLNNNNDNNNTSNTKQVKETVPTWNQN